MRTFVAIELDRALREPLVRLLREQLPRTRDVRWCTEQQLHLTLKFLGDVRDEQLAKVYDAVGQATRQVEPFTIRLAPLGCFPTPRSPRVLWCGIEDASRSCARWIELADPLFEALGFPRETRAFHPHITLGRSKNRDGGNVMRSVLDQLAPPPSRVMTVREVIVFESRLDPRGAQYTPHLHAPLGQ
jgi:2'-5' RNA ligase